MIMIRIPLRFAPCLGAPGFLNRLDADFHDHICTPLRCAPCGLAGHAAATRPPASGFGLDALTLRLRLAKSSLRSLGRRGWPRSAACRGCAPHPLPPPWGGSLGTAPAAYALASLAGRQRPCGLCPSRTGSAPPRPLRCHASGRVRAGRPHPHALRARLPRGASRAPAAQE